MSMKARITRELSKATSDKAELNKTVLKWKKHFDEAGKVIGADRKRRSRRSCEWRRDLRARILKRKF